MEQIETQEKINWHDKYYKLLLLIPISFLIFSVIYMSVFYSTKGDFFQKDISLTGGTTVTINEKIDINDLEQYLSSKAEEVSIRGVYDLVTQEQKAVIIETKSNPDEIKKILEDYLKIELINGENLSFEFTGASLSESFYKQLLTAFVFAFILMSIVVFIIYRKIVPSFTVIFCVFADILMTLTAVNIFGIKMSSAGIMSFLMLIGYSVDTDILLTTKILKRDEGTLNKRIYDAFRTGITMTLTSVFAVGSALIIVRSFSMVLNQVFTILLIGLFFDIINTWITNASILKWVYVKK